MSLTTMATATASTKRALVVSGKRGLPTAYLNNIACTPLTPAATDLMQRLKLETLAQVYSTIIPGSYDIVAGDVLTLASQDYDVRDVSPWTMPVSNEQFMALVVEKVVS